LDFGLGTMSTDNFQFRFTPADAQTAANVAIRACIAKAFGYPERLRVLHRFPRAGLIGMGYQYDEATECWVPDWWPRWSDG